MKTSILLILSGALSAIASPMGSTEDLRNREPADSVSGDIALLPRGTAADYDIGKRGNVQHITPSKTRQYHVVMLNQHNAHRNNHSVADLTWSTSLSQEAEKTAKKCVFDHDNKGKPWGQNLAASASSEDQSKLVNAAGAYAVTNLWYNGEAPKYVSYGKANPSTADNYKITGHFTQVIWKGTTKVGCFSHYCPSGKIVKDLKTWFTVCNYASPGNVNDNYAKNVLKSNNKVATWTIDMK